MISLDEGELLERLKDVKDSVDQAAILSDLGNLHLAEACTASSPDCSLCILNCCFHLFRCRTTPSPGKTSMGGNFLLQCTKSS